MKEISLFKEIHGKPTTHCLVLADEYQETKIVTEIDIWANDGSIGICKFLNEARSPDSDHISNVRILFFETLEEYEQFISDFHKK